MTLSLAILRVSCRQCVSEQNFGRMTNVSFDHMSHFGCTSCHALKGCNVQSQQLTPAASSSPLCSATPSCRVVHDRAYSDGHSKSCSFTAWG